MPRASTERRDGAAGRAAGEAGLSRSAVRALRQFLNAHREGWRLERRLATAARMAAEDARQQGLPPERMLVVLKGAWGALGEVHRLPPLDARDLLSELVTLTIHAYYEPVPRSQPPAGHRRRAGTRTAA